MDPFDKSESDLQQEIQVLQEIYINELQVDRDSRGCICCISLQLHPATGDQVDQKWVCLTLVLKLSSKYPDVIPEIQIKNPRGLAEEYVSRLQCSLEKLAEGKRGECMLFELIELAKDTLTQGNLPHGECVICKEGFSEEEHFTKTQCYHYFHCHCLLRYIKFSEQQIEEDYRAALQNSPHVKVEKKKVVCPVCREPFPYDLAQLEKYPQDSDIDPLSITISPQIRSIQQKMAALFQKQHAKGGIIDIEAEKNKYLISSSSSVSLGLVNGLTAEDNLLDSNEASQEALLGKGVLFAGLDFPKGQDTAESWNVNSKKEYREDPSDSKLGQQQSDPDTWPNTSKSTNVIDSSSVQMNSYTDRQRQKNMSKSRPRNGYKTDNKNYIKGQQRESRTETKSNEVSDSHTEGNGTQSLCSGLESIKDEQTKNDLDKDVANGHEARQRKKIQHRNRQVYHRQIEFETKHHINTHTDDDLDSATRNPPADKYVNYRSAAPGRGGRGRSRRGAQMLDPVVQLSSEVADPKAHKSSSMDFVASSKTYEHDGTDFRDGKSYKGRYRERRPDRPPVSGPEGAKFTGNEKTSQANRDLRSRDSHEDDSYRSDPTRAFKGSFHCHSKHSEVTPLEFEHKQHFNYKAKNYPKKSGYRGKTRSWHGRRDEQRHCHPLECSTDKCYDSKDAVS